MYIQSIAIFAVAFVTSPGRGVGTYIIERKSGAVECAFSISYVTVVYRQSTVSDTEKPVNELGKLSHPAVAVRKGRPNKVLSDLIDELTHSRNSFLLREAAAIDYGDDGFFWKIKWWLFPSGGSSGPMCPFYTIVRGDGTIVRPSVFLRDYCGSWFSGTENILFSVLAIDDLLPKSDLPPDNKQIRKSAESTLAQAVSTYRLKDRFRFDSIERMTFSGRLKSTEDSNAELEVWAVRFVVDGVKKSVKDPDSPTCITVWVASDLVTSELTVDEWDPVSIRSAQKDRGSTSDQGEVYGASDFRREHSFRDSGGNRRLETLREAD